MVKDDRAVRDPAESAASAKADRLVHENLAVAAHRAVLANLENLREAAAARNDLERRRMKSKDFS